MDQIVFSSLLEYQLTVHECFTALMDTVFREYLPLGQKLLPPPLPFLG